MNTAATNAELSLEQKRAVVARLLLEKGGPYPYSANLTPRWFEQQVERTPAAVAVVAGGQGLSYAELNAQANRLARRLRALGVGPEVLVGLCAGRSAATVVGLLAILKAGGAYVPVDPSYPSERIAFMLADAQVSVLLTEIGLRDQLPSGEARIVCLDSPCEPSEQQSEKNLDGGATAGNLAYVIYTSGSTGRPKGVQITHGALSNLLQSMRRLLSISQRDALMAVTTLSFDIAALEIFLPLIVGARVELIEREVAIDGARLVERLKNPEITILQATPATWRMLLAAGWRGQPGLQMLCGGEALPRAVGRWAPRQGSGAVERLRSHRDDDLVVGLSGRSRRSVDLDRPADRQYAILRTRQAAASGTGGGDRRALHRGPGAGPRLSASCWIDGGAVSARSVRDDARGSVVPDGRSGAMAWRWHARMPGAG